MDGWNTEMISKALDQGGSTLVFAILMAVLALWVIPAIIKSMERKQTQMIESAERKQTEMLKAFKDEMALEREVIKEVGSKVLSLDQFARGQPMKCNYPPGKHPEGILSI